MPICAQVFCNGLIPAVLAVLCAYIGGLSDLPLGAQRSRLSTAAAGAFFGWGWRLCCFLCPPLHEPGAASEQGAGLQNGLRQQRYAGEG